MQIEYDKVYTFDMTGKVSFGDLPAEVLYDMYKDGRVFSKFGENILPIWFPELLYVDAKGHDHIQKTTNKQFDLKSFTKGGCNYAPSNMIGKGRELVLEDAHSHAKIIDYIIADIVEFPKIRIIFKKGTDLLNEYPSCKIEFKHRDKLFNC